RSRAKCSESARRAHASGEEPGPIPRERSPEVLIEVRAPDTTDIYDAAHSLALPDGGVITLSVAPVPQRLGQILRPALEALAGVPLARSASGTAQEAENALARLRAHGVHTLVLLNARWVPSTLRGDLARAATMAGLRLFVIHHPHD